MIFGCDRIDLQNFENVSTKTKYVLSQLIYFSLITHLNITIYQ
jgi:hypothetical protein